MRLVVVCLLFMLFAFAGYAQTDSTRTVTRVKRQQVYTVLDSLAQAHADSVSMLFISPDPNRPNAWVEQLLKKELYTGYAYLDIKSPSKKTQHTGELRKVHEYWVLIVIILLLIYTAVVRLVFNKDVSMVLRSVYDTRLFSQTDTESNLINVWAFLALFILFCFTFGLFFYQLSVYNRLYYPVTGASLLLALSGAVMLLFALKFVLLRFIGFVFNLGEVVNKYTAVLSFTYFTVTFLFLPVVACMALLTLKLVPVILLTALVLTGVILIWLYLRNSVIIISNFRFSKFYLIVYLCALEICPILLLVKALNIV